MRREKRQAEQAQRYFADRERLRAKRQQRMNTNSSPGLSSDPLGDGSGGGVTAAAGFNSNSSPSLAGGDEAPAAGDGIRNESPWRSFGRREVFVR